MPTRRPLLPFKCSRFPAVYAFQDGKVIDGFVGALPESGVREFVGRLVHAPSEADLLVGRAMRPRCGPRSSCNRTTRAQ